MLRVIESTGKEGLATVFVARTGNGRLIEFAESFQPGQSIDQKWVLILSVMHGCPVRCLMCDAGQAFLGNLSKEDILAQVGYLVRRRFPDGRVPSRKFKVQFTRMGEPAYNPAVLEALEELPRRFDAPGLIPSVSTVAPLDREGFFESLLEVKQRLYRQGHFQLQFSVHSTDEAKRDQLIPVKKWGLRDLASYGERFFEAGDRKVTLNFALMQGYPVEPKRVAEFFDPRKFLVKITPLNPTQKAASNRLLPAFDACRENPVPELVQGFKDLGFDVILSIGDLEENQVGSNCGQFVSALEATRLAKPRIVQSE